MRRCPDPDRLARFLAGTIGRAEFEPLEAHIEGCPDCQRALDELTRADDLAWQLPGVSSAALAPAAAPAARPVAPGFVLESRGQAGGHGVVFRAVESSLGRVVALKVLRDGSLAEGPARSSLANEARAVARLSHPNVVRLHGLAEADGRPALVMEWVAGGSLARRLDGRPLPARDAARLVEALARGVAHAHESGVLHRDIKPSNVLLPGPGLDGPKLGDFGLAKILGQEVERTQTVAVVGTPGYMAPELASAGPGAAGPAADVYSLGALLFELLTGGPPFRAATPFETLLLARDREPVSPRSIRPGLPRDLETACLKCLEKDPARRYASAAALADDLGRFLRGEPVAARPVGRAAKLARWCRRNPAVASLAALAASLLVGGLAGLAALWRTAEARGALARTAAAEARLALQLYAPLAKRIFRDPAGLSEAEHDDLDRALALSLRAMSQAGVDPEDEHCVAYAALEIADALLLDGQPARAESACRPAVEALGRLARAHPGRVPYVYHYAQGCSQLATILHHLGRPDEALRLRREAVRVGEGLAAGMPPHRYAYLKSLALWWSALAVPLADRGELARAGRLHRDAAEALGRLREAHPDDPDLPQYHREALYRLARFGLDRQGDLDAYLAPIREAAAQTESLRASGRPGWAEACRGIECVLAESAFELDRAGRPAEAAEALGQAIGWALALAERLPDGGDHRRSAAAYAFEQGLILRRDDPGAATARFREAVAAMERLAAESGRPCDRVALARFLAACPDPAVRDPARAAAEARRASAQAPGDPGASRALAACLAEAGDDRAALAAWTPPAGPPAPDEVEALAARASALWRLGRRDEARAALGAASAVASPGMARLAVDRARRLIEGTGRAGLAGPAG